jgi:hypothetical protein
LTGAEQSSQDIGPRDSLVCVLSRKLRHSISNFAAHRLVILGGKALQNLRTDCFPLALL